MEKSKKKKRSPWSNNGGARNGAGMKPEGDSARVKVSGSLPVSVYEYMQTTGMNVGRIAEKLITRTKGYREWLAKNKK